MTTHIATTYTTTNNPYTYKVVYWGNAKGVKNFEDLLEVVEFLQSLGGTATAPDSASVYNPAWKGGSLSCAYIHGWISAVPSKELTPWVWEYPKKTPQKLPQDAALIIEVLESRQWLKEMKEEVNFLRREVAEYIGHPIQDE